MSQFEYKGYIGNAQICYESECLHGRIVNISGLVTYEAETVGELKEEFEKAVDDYIDMIDKLSKGQL